MRIAIGVLLVAYGYGNGYEYGALLRCTEEVKMKVIPNLTPSYSNFMDDTSTGSFPIHLKDEVVVKAVVEAADAATAAAAAATIVLYLYLLLRRQLFPSRDDVVVAVVLYYHYHYYFGLYEIK